MRRQLSAVVAVAARAVVEVAGEMARVCRAVVQPPVAACRHRQQGRALRLGATIRRLGRTRERAHRPAARTRCRARRPVASSTARMPRPAASRPTTTSTGTLARGSLLPRQARWSPDPSLLQRPQPHRRHRLLSPCRPLNPWDSRRLRRHLHRLRPQHRAHARQQCRQAVRRIPSVDPAGTRQHWGPTVPSTCSPRRRLRGRAISY